MSGEFGEEIGEGDERRRDGKMIGEMMRGEWEGTEERG